jgi:hypothetical protein
MVACFTPAFLLYQSLLGTAFESMERVEAVICTRRSEVSNAAQGFTVFSACGMAGRFATPLKL